MFTICQTDAPSPTFQFSPAFKVALVPFLNLNTLEQESFFFSVKDQVRNIFIFLTISTVKGFKGQRAL